MLLTIVIPVYNVRNYLDECLSSLPNNCKVVLVNDGSTDGSEVICRQYAKEKGNTIIVDKPNGGLADARNFGMQYVDTPYVFFLDSDDRVNGDNLMKALNFAIEHNIDWLQCGYAYDYGKHILVYKNKLPVECDKTQIVRQLANDGFVKNFAWGKIYRTSIVRKFKFPKGKYFEDSYWQYLIVDQSSTFGIFPEIVSYYRQRTESISGSFSIRNLDLIEGLSQRLDFYIEHSTEYAYVVNEAAVNLWSNACLAAQLAYRASTDLYETYTIAANTIKELYQSHILNGISKKPLLRKLELKALFNGQERLSYCYNLCNRLIGRFRSSDYKTVPVKKSL